MWWRINWKQCVVIVVAMAVSGYLVNQTYDCVKSLFESDLISKLAYLAWSFSIGWLIGVVGGKVAWRLK